MSGLIARANARLTAWLARAATMVVLTIAMVTFCDVIARYFLNAPFSFTVELTEMAMALLVYFGVGLVTHENGHISADFIVLRLPLRMRALLACATNLLALGFLAVTVWRLWLRAGFLFAKGDTTPVWGVPVWPVAFAMAFGSIFLLTGVALQLGDVLMRLINPERASPPGAAPAPYRE